MCNLHAYAESIFDGRSERGRNRDGAAFANSLDSERIERAWSDDMRLY